MQKSLEEWRIHREHLERYDYRSSAEQVFIGEETSLEKRFALGATVPHIEPLEDCKYGERNCPGFPNVSFKVFLE